MAKAKEAAGEQLDIADRRLLDLLQRDFPRTTRPFAAIGDKLGATAEMVVRGVHGSVMTIPPADLVE